MTERQQSATAMIVPGAICIPPASQACLPVSAAVSPEAPETLAVCRRLVPGQEPASRRARFHDIGMVHVTCYPPTCS
jgi:hypothetical protein